MSQSESQKARVREILQDATMPFALGTAVKRYLKQTRAYERARANGVSRDFLDSEALALGRKLAAVVQEHLEGLR